MKGEMGGQISKMMNKMIDIMGMDPMEILTDEEVDELLNKTFAKFDKDKSGKIENPEFHKAREFLGLKVT